MIRNEEIYYIQPYVKGSSISYFNGLSFIPRYGYMATMNQSKMFLQVL